ncbi:MAG: PAS domain S-box protein, partial [Spirochaetales bacterium]
MNIVIIAAGLTSSMNAQERFSGRVPCALLACSPVSPEDSANAERLGAVILELPEPRLRRILVGAWVSGVAAALSRLSEITPGTDDYERRYEDLVHALPDIVYELDPNGIFTFLNDSIGLLGYKPPELIGKHFSIILHDDDAAAVDRDKILADYHGHRTGQALSPKLFNERRGIDRKTAELEVRLRKKVIGSGVNTDLIGEVISYGEVSAAGEYSKSGRGEFRGSVGIIRDVTLRRKSEEMLRKLYQAVDQLGSCVFVINHAFETEYVNPSFFLLTGFSPADVIGRSIFRFFAFPPEKAESMRKHVQDGFDIREEVLVPKVRGGRFWVDFSLSPVRSPGGIVTHAIAIVEDVSSRKSIEELLRNAQREAESANQAKTRFLASMTHELKNPITGIMSAAKLIGMAPEDAPKKAESIIEYAQTLLDILTGILDYVRSEGSDATVQRLTFPLGAFMEGLCGPFREKARAKGLEFTLKVDDIETVEGDPDRLGRALGILLDNAVKFTSAGSVSVRAAIERREGNVPHIKVEVRDTGVGIGPEDWDRIFQPFTRIGELRGAEARGAGIGLALARNLVRVLGGEIRMDSDPGNGSVFTFIVPSGTPVVELASGKSAPYVVLVVDDNEVNLEYMRTLIENAGFTVRTAEGAAEAFRVMENRYIDAAILDIQMPGYSGLELGKTIRAYAGNRYAPSMPLFAMTAHDPREVEGVEHVFHTVFSKPTDIRRLLETVKTALMEREMVSMVYFNSSFIGKRSERLALVATMRDVIVGAGEKLRSALHESDSRIDVRAEAAKFSSLFQRFAHPAGLDLVRLF